MATFERLDSRNGTRKRKHTHCTKAPCSPSQLATGVSVSLVWTAAQERVFRVPGFTFGGWMALMTVLTYSVLGAAEMLLTGAPRRAEQRQLVQTPSRNPMAEELALRQEDIW